jgi:hypothetical protein
MGKHTQCIVHRIHEAVFPMSVKLRLFNLSGVIFISEASYFLYCVT